MFPVRILAASVLMALSISVADGHEFWIDAHDWQVDTGDRIVADLVNGQQFQGVKYAYFPPNFRRFDVALGDGVTPVNGRLGDRPAADLAAPGEGLVTLIHQTTDNTVNYSEWEKFVSFVEHKDAAWVVEAYSRYAKGLIAVGAGDGSDRSRGLEIEIIALANPYTDDLSAGLPVVVAYKGAPRVDAQVEVFERPTGDAPEVAVFTLRTDQAGQALIPVKPGHAYLLDSVVLREPSEALADEKNAVWESLWASLTFEVPQ
ncbi:MAG: DUF4198 domain-containing protein [Rhodobacteraceae bacterium]|nr:DUF4198 domain-containing protein [Paracoccaceae bacterium]